MSHEEYKEQQSPLKQPLFRWLWMATIVSNTGTWMQEVANSWLGATRLIDNLEI